MKLFAQIRKVDEAKRLVFGRLAEEAVDKADEIMDYASSKPYFQKWSEDVAKATDGSSVGNLRAMHGKVAAGKFTQMDFNDAEKAIDVCAKVVDDNEWQKVLEGVYTGFSIGGSYVGDKKVEKVNGRDATRYTAKPSEGSLVDRPCMGGARFFEVQKADGSLAKVDFQETLPDAPVQGTAEEVAELGKLMNENGLAVADLLKAFPAFLKDKEKKPAAEGEAAPKEGAAAEGEAKPEAKAPPATADDMPEGRGGAGPGKTDEAVEAEKMAKVAAAKEFFKDNPLCKALADDELVKQHDAAREAANELTKVEKPNDALQKMVADAVAPLQKQLDDAAALIKKLSEQPAPAKVSLRAVAKTEDTDTELKKREPETIVDSHGEKHEAASLIKSIHSTGGAPLAMPTNLRK